ncbi:spermatogenesis-associated protein 7 isoform X3 [Corvus moneduloides]|uniref:spermatogenesis-associated protein 7 isoform X3 n=1 Tax=Corvus moneduloides TaxID=1196302 RepID=UPI001362A048|nr:spermatogenesis-associated protein 7 isoform X3 [Corvus moneduloides]
MTTASGYSPVVIPRCGPASPFKGHLSTKSNAFCIDSSRSLTGQYLIRDHMVFHYNRILSAKAAVDCSVPKSRLTSIKFADQQRREKLKKKIARCEEKMSICETVSRSCSRDSGRLLPSSFRKSFLEVEDNLFPCAGQAQYLSRAPSPFGQHGSVRSSPVKHARKCSRNTSRASHSCVCTSRPPSKHSGLSCSHSIDNFVSIGCSQRCQGNNPKVSSGDLLERHSEYFTKSRKPFTPRTLISNAKSLLTEYRYYTPARRKKKNRRKQRVEAQTQTDMISFPSADKVYVRKVMCEHQKIPSKAEAKRYTLDEPERGIDGCQYSILRETSRHPQKCSPRRTAEAEEEELLYLTFIEDVTNEILRLGLFSNRVLDQLFECYIEENKNRLDEGKMRQMLDALKSDLGCSQDSDTELIHEDRDSDTELIHEGRDSDTELIHEGQDSDTELIHEDRDSNTELIHEDRDSDTELIHEGRDSDTELIHEDRDSDTELIHEGRDSDTELIHEGLDSETELIQASREASESLDLQESDTIEELEFTSKGHRLRKATKSEEFLESINLSLQEPNKYESLSFSERSRETQSREDFSEDTTEMMDAGTESDFCGVEFEEHPDTLPTCEAASNLIACDSDLEVNKELDELKENFADTLHISRNYS